MQGARNEIFALQPAPVQTSYMGFPATMGASFLPYLITDKVVAPESCRHCYSENLALMPNCYFVNDYKHAHMVRRPHQAQKDHCKANTTEAGKVHPKSHELHVKQGEASGHSRVRRRSCSVHCWSLGQRPARCAVCCMSGCYC